MLTIKEKMKEKIVWKAVYEREDGVFLSAWLGFLSVADPGEYLNKYLRTYIPGRSTKAVPGTLLFAFRTKKDGLQWLEERKVAFGKNLKLLRCKTQSELIKIKRINDPHNNADCALFRWFWEWFAIAPTIVGYIPTPRGTIGVKKLTPSPIQTSKGGKKW